jgi:hypothetical protein
MEGSCYDRLLFFLCSKSMFRISPRLSHHQHDENVEAITKERGGWKKIVKINIFLCHFPLITLVEKKQQEKFRRR